MTYTYPTGERTQPMILFSHIPLSHPDTKSCGPLREQGTIRRGVGPGYQNTLDKQTTEFLLESIRPLVVFRYVSMELRPESRLNYSHSGDDRDYCEHTHAITPSDPDASNATLIREITVKSFSPAVNIRRTGFQLLSLASSTALPPGSTTQTFADVPCFLPDQSAIIMSFYLPSLLVTIGILVLSNAYRTRNQLHLSPFLSPISISTSPSRSPTPSPPSPSGRRSPWPPMTPSWPEENERSQRVNSRGPMTRMPRTPSTLSAPAYRASRPASPYDSPLLTPTVLFHHDDQEEDTMFPPQYAVRREHRPEQNHWPSGYDQEDHEDEAAIVYEKTFSVKKEHGHKRRTSHFLPAPGNKPSGQKRWTYSWTFVFRDRRRRLTVPPELPGLDSLRDIADDIWNWRGSGIRRRGLLWGLAADGISVAWPAIFIWGVILRWMF